MNLQELRALLEDPRPSTRLMSAHILRMVDEVQALDAVQNAAQREEIEKVAQDLRAVAKYLAQLKQHNYNTIAAICQQYNVYSDVLLNTTQEEFETICELLKEYRANPLFAEKDNNMRTSLGYVSQVLGDIRGKKTADLRMRLHKRLPPIVPTKKDIKNWLPLLKSPKVADRIHGLLQLNLSNNPASLQYMAYVYVNDPEHKVREKAKQLGRKLYWNTIYYEMSRNGTLERIMVAFAASLRLVEIEEHQIPDVEDTVEAILSRAENNRKRRGWESE